MVDKSAIFNELTKRNALRRDAGLPLLNMKTEYAFQVALAEEREAYASASQYEDQRILIREQVIDELREKHGQQFGYCMGSRWAITNLTNERFYDFLRERGIDRPKHVSRHAIIYGGAKK